MIWLILAVLVIVFIIGYLILNSDTRKAMRSMATLLKISPLSIELMLQEMGNRQSQALVQLINEGYSEQIKKAAYLIFIYQTFIKDPSDANIALWHTMLLRAHLSPQLNAEHTEAALFYFSEFDLDAFELAQFRRNYNHYYNQDMLE